MTKEGDVILDVEAYDGMYTPDFGMSMHTWKDTYLYFDGVYKLPLISHVPIRKAGCHDPCRIFTDLLMQDITGKSHRIISTEEEFAGFTNAQALKEAIADELWQPDTEELEYSYFKRKNNILHIQCIRLSGKHAAYDDREQQTDHDR